MFICLHNFLILNRAVFHYRRQDFDLRLSFKKKMPPNPLSWKILWNLKTNWC